MTAKSLEPAERTKGTKGSQRQSQSQRQRRVFRDPSDEPVLDSMEVRSQTEIHIRRESRVFENLGLL